jgi:hypothetical protein
MEDIDSEQFKSCMRKKSKYYYKLAFKLTLGLIGIVGVIVGISYGVEFLIKFINADNLFFICIGIIYLICVSGLTWALSDGSENIIKDFVWNFIALHGIFIVFASTIAICLIGLIAIPAELAIIAGKFIYDLTNNTMFTIVGGIVVFILTIPVNISAFECLKIDPYTSEMIEKSLRWLRVHGRHE